MRLFSLFMIVAFIGAMKCMIELGLNASVSSYIAMLQEWSVFEVAILCFCIVVILLLNLSSSRALGQGWRK